jgi:hypothetical protein
VTIEEFAPSSGTAASEFLDLDHASKSVNPASFVIPMFLANPAASWRASEAGH